MQVLLHTEDFNLPTSGTAVGLVHKEEKKKKRGFLECLEDKFFKVENEVTRGKCSAGTLTHKKGTANQKLKGQGFWLLLPGCSNHEMMEFQLLK